MDSLEYLWMAGVGFIAACVGAVELREHHHQVKGALSSLGTAWAKASP